jgi:hypothetical protein
MAGSRSNRTLSANLGTLRSLANWAVSSMANPQPNPERYLTAKPASFNGSNARALNRVKSAQIISKWSIYIHSLLQRLCRLGLVEPMPRGRSGSG